MPATDPDIASALATLGARDPVAADEARSALEWLTARGGLAGLSQDRLEFFLWYELPAVWPGGASFRRGVVAALAEALDLLGLPRYAAVCRSETTAAVLDAYRRGKAQGRSAFHKAAGASAVSPPDLPEFQWGKMLGPQEARVLSSVADFLELAIAAGEVTPGSRGWKNRREALVRAHLTRPRPELGGISFLDTVKAERREHWLGLHQTGAWPRLLTDLAPLLAQPAALPPGAGDPVPPLRWLLTCLADGQTLTETGSLSRAFAQDASARFGWWPGRAPGKPRNEDELHDLRQTHDLAVRLKALRRRGSTLTLSPRGRALLADPEALWRAAAQAILRREPFYAAAGEVTLALLVVDGAPRETALDAEVAATVAAQGWHDRRTGVPADEQAVGAARYMTTNLLRALNLLESSGPWPRTTLRLTPVGRATALEALYHRATGPIPRNAR